MRKSWSTVSNSPGALCRISSSVAGLIPGERTSATPRSVLQISDCHLRRYPIRSDCAGQVSALSLLSSSSAKRPWQSSREVEKIAPNLNGSKLRGRAKLDEESLAFDERSHLAYGLIADQISAPVLSAPTDLLREQIRWSTAPTVLGQTEPAEPPNRTPDPAAPSDLVLLLGTNRMRPGDRTRVSSLLPPNRY